VTEQPQPPEQPELATQVSEAPFDAPAPIETAPVEAAAVDPGLPGAAPPAPSTGPATGAQPAPGASPAPAPPFDVASPNGGGIADQRPEIIVGIAFAGGFLAAQILKRLGNR
jgi:hypothetical protein